MKTVMDSHTPPHRRPHLSGHTYRQPRPQHANHPHPLYAMPWSLPLVLLLLSVALTPVTGTQNGELCVVETPLKTEYFTPVVETPAHCYGCLFPLRSITATQQSSPSPSISQVHIIHVEDPEDGAVEVVVAGHSSLQGSSSPLPSSSDGEGMSSRIALVLHSSRSRAPVVFTVNGIGMANNTKHIFLVSGDDEVGGSNLRYSIAHRQRSIEDDVITTMERKFGFVSSYTRAPHANKIILHLTPEVRSGEGCIGTVSSGNPISNCFVSIKQPIAGCYHRYMLGENDRDIHIIDVEGSSNPNGSLVLSVVGNGEGSSGGISMGDGTGVERNMTLVLRTSRPTTWSLHTTRLHGTITLLVGGGDQVENTSVPSPGVMVEVRRVDVPATFDQLILRVLTKLGPPVSYTRTTAPNKITIVVPSKKQNRVVMPSYIPDNDHPEEHIEDPTTLIHDAMSVSCDQNTMTIAVPRHISERVGGIFMSLADRSCVGVMNKSHIFIRERFGRCKFTKQNSSYQTTFTNFVNVEVGPSLSDDEDFAGSGYGSQDEYYSSRIPPLQVQCQVDPPPGPSRSPVPDPQPDNNMPEGDSTAGGATYKMDVFRDRNYKNLIKPDDLMSTNINRKLYVRTALASVLPSTAAYDADLRVVLEDCWLSNTSSPLLPGNPREPLIRKSCPLHSSVIIEPLHIHSKTSDFNFKVLSGYSYLGAFFLHCQLGVCSADALPRPAVNRCIDPGRYCGKPELLRVFNNQPSSSSLQTLTLGPFTMTSSTQSAWSGNTVRINGNTASRGKGGSDSHIEDLNKKDKAQIVVLGGLSTEVVVGIALASFVIGVCLTATLWVIHMKTDPRRQKRPESGAPRNSGYDLSAHSGSSTPSSQAPMTA